MWIWKANRNSASRLGDQSKLGLFLWSTKTQWRFEMILTRRHHERKDNFEKIIPPSLPKISTAPSYTNCLFLFFNNSLFYCRATERGVQGGTMTPGPMDFRGPMRKPMSFRKAFGFSGPSRGQKSSRGAHRNDTEISKWGLKTFFFDRKNR